MEPLTLVIAFGGIALYYGLYYLYTVHDCKTGKRKMRKKHDRK